MGAGAGALNRKMAGRGLPSREVQCALPTFTKTRNHQLDTEWLIQGKTNHSDGTSRPKIAIYRISKPPPKKYIPTYFSKRLTKAKKQPKITAQQFFPYHASEVSCNDRQICYLL